MAETLGAQLQVAAEGRRVAEALSASLAAQLKEAASRAHLAPPQSKAAPSLGVAASSDLAVKLRAAENAKAAAELELARERARCAPSLATSLCDERSSLLVFHSRIGRVSQA